MSGGGQTSSTVNSSQPPAYLQPYLQYGAQQAKAQYQSAGPSYYPGSTVAAQSPYTTAANQGIAALASRGAPTSNAASGYLTGLLNGNYLRAGNPYQAALDKSIGDAVIPTVESQFSAAGRYGSPAMAGAMTRALADAIAPQHYATYNDTLGLMNSGAGLAPGLDQAPYYGLAQLASAGQGQDSYNQSLANADVNKWNYNQNLPYNKLGQYMGLLSAQNWGTQGTSTTQPGGGLGGFLGGLLGGIL
jgi:hypothetical protein